jgi:hypothetical protein
MTTYQKIYDPMVSAISTKIIRRVEDNAFIPFAPDNVDYQAYLAWLDEGNEPLPADEV